MEYSIGFFALAAAATLFAGISKGGFGSGASFASASILALILEPKTALGIMLPLLMLIDLAALRPYWGKWERPEAVRLILGAVPGILLGILLFRWANDDVLRILIGIMCLWFVATQLMPKPAAGRAKLPGWMGNAAGTFAGFTSFVSHAGGPPIGVYLLRQGYDKTTYQATTVIVFWVVNIFKAVPYAFLGAFTLQTGLLDLALAPFALFGAWIGVKLHYRIPEKAFFNITYVLLVLTGCKLIWDALV